MSADIQRERLAENHLAEGRLARLSSDDILAVAAAYKRAARRAELFGTAGVVGGFAVGAVLLQLRGWLGWPERLDLPFLLTGFALAYLSAVFSWRRQRQELTRFQLLCSSCNAAMLTSHPWRSEVSRAELIASTGAYPSCGARILEEAH